MKQHTIIFVPHARAKFRKWRLTTLQAGLILGTLATLTVGGIGTTILYFQTAFDRSQLDDIQRENAELRQKNQGFERSVREIRGQLDEYQQQIQKLAIVAGVSELSPNSDAGIGGPVSMASTDSDLGGHLASLHTEAVAIGQDMQKLQQSFDERSIKISRTPAVTPVKGLLTSRFGERADPFTEGPAFHGGIDIVAPRGKEVHATGDGLVIKTGQAAGLGNAVFISHGYGITTRYGHLMKILVKEGQKIRRGDVLGLVGNTGRATGYHLHYEVRVDGQAVDPMGYILDHGPRPAR